MDSLEKHTDYGSVALDEGDLAANPLDQFAVWLDDAERAGIYEPNAMVVGTVDSESRPSSRTVLLKGLDSVGFEFVTNYRSLKGMQLAENPGVSLLFPWYPLNRQVIVLGTARFATAESSDAYFASRPRESQLASMASEQSQPVGSRAMVEQRVAELTKEFEGVATVPRPSWWGGVRVVPRSIEFWQGRTSRLHDRLRYTATAEGTWTIERLQP
ncbi:pyridoxamine 5'-phosphate oxidase [Salinibacterium sp.]|uniref:pyridoxamine 5'-phosphate oxidase n=1 Tax=Salinibacterium sp. TaxID=1915057 RepID=UPI00286AE264|nr:pyridoxamine 5'-phosphate oxidase [Salinibacterium sp.]